MGMMMDRFRKAGGFLNNVDALITDLTFTNTPDFGEASRERREGEFTPLWLTLTTRTDGAEKAESTNINMGGGDDFIISEDGRSLIPTSKDSMLWASTPGARLIASGYAHGIPEPSPEPGEPLDFSNFIGYRVRFTQVVDEESKRRMAEKVKKNPKKYPKYNTEGQRKGKDGKYYDPRNPEITQVYGLVEEAQAAHPTTRAMTSTVKSPTTGRANGKATHDSGKAVNGKTAVNDEALRTFSGETLVALLQAHDGQLKKVQLNQFVTRSLAKDGRREDVRKFLFNDDNLLQFAEEGITVGCDFYTVNFDRSGRDQVVSLQ